MALIMTYCILYLCVLLQIEYKSNEIILMIYIPKKAVSVIFCLVDEMQCPKISLSVSSRTDIRNKVEELMFSLFHMVNI